MKAHVDKDTCIGCGLCPSICEAVFVLEDDGKAAAYVDEVPSEVEDEAKEAESSCPVNADLCRGWYFKLLHLFKVDKFILLPIGNNVGKEFIGTVLTESSSNKMKASEWL